LWNKICGLGLNNEDISSPTKKEEDTFTHLGLNQLFILVLVYV